MKLTTISALALVVLEASLAGCSAPPSSEVDVSSSQALCADPASASLHPEICPVIPPPKPPPIVVPHAPLPPAFPAPTEIICTTGDTCTYTPTGLTGPSGTACSEPYWYMEATTAVPPVAVVNHMTMYCALGSVEWDDEISTWIAANPTLQPVKTTSEPSLPAPAPGYAYVEFLPPIPTTFPAPPAPTTTSLVGPVAWGSIRVTWLPCTQLYSSSGLQLPAPIQNPDVMLCVPSANFLGWADPILGVCEHTPGSNSCHATAITDGSEIGLSAAPYGYIYVEYSAFGGPIGGGCEGCGGAPTPVPPPHY